MCNLCPTAARQNAGKEQKANRQSAFETADFDEPPVPKKLSSRKFQKKSSEPKSYYEDEEDS